MFEYSFNKLKTKIDAIKDRNIYNEMRSLLQSSLIETNYNSETSFDVRLFEDNDSLRKLNVSSFDAYSQQIMEIDYNLEIFLKRARTIQLLYLQGNMIVYRTLTLRNIYWTTESAYILMVVIHYMKTLLYSPLHELTSWTFPDLNFTHIERGNEYEFKVRDAREFAKERGEEFVEPEDPKKKISLPPLPPSKTVKEKYKELLMLFHPDQGGCTVTAQLITEAFREKNFDLIHSYHHEFLNK